MAGGSRPKTSASKALNNWRSGKGAHSLVLRVYHLTATMPSDQKFGLISQMQRAAVSVPANIAEGFKRRTRADKVHFYHMAQGSFEEARYYFILCRDLGYKLEYDSMARQADQVGRVLTGLIRSVRVKPDKPTYPTYHLRPTTYECVRHTGGAARPTPYGPFLTRWRELSGRHRSQRSRPLPGREAIPPVAYCPHGRPDAAASSRFRSWH